MCSLVEKKIQREKLTEDEKDKPVGDVGD